MEEQQVPKMGITIDEKILAYHLGDSHPMNSSRIFPAYHLIRENFLDNEELDIIVPTAVSRELIEKAHDSDFIDTMEKLSNAGEGMAPEFGIGMGDCPTWKGMNEASEFVVSSTVTSAEKLYKDDYGIAFELMGGLHHARSAKASGFCYYNDINVAIEKLKTLDDSLKILYIDTDVHHGDGTQFDYYNDPNVLTISFHESGQFIFPGTGFPDEIGTNQGIGHSVNLPFFPYSWDADYLNRFEEIVPPIFESYQPDFVIWQAGVDGHKDDILGHLRLTTNTYKSLAERIKELSIQNMDSVKILSLGGGGYNPDSVAKSWTNIVSGLSGIDLPKTASDEWLKLCKDRGIEVTKNMLDNPSTGHGIEEKDRIIQANDQYLEALKENIEPYFSI